MTGETRDAGHSARVRRADRMRSGLLSEPVELQSDRHSRPWTIVGRTLDQAIGDSAAFQPPLAAL
jgi:hypothetical protein